MTIVDRLATASFIEAIRRCEAEARHAFAKYIPKFELS